MDVYSTLFELLYWQGAKCINIKILIAAACAKNVVQVLCILAHKRIKTPLVPESIRQLFHYPGQPAPLFIALHVIHVLAPHS